MKESGQSQISTSDPDSRHLITRNNITEVAYSLQTTVDTKNNIPINYRVTNSNDKKAMGPMFRRAKTILRDNQFTALYDKGYHTGSELAIADALGIQAIVAIPPFSGASHAPGLDYDVEHFDYNPENDTYTCLQGHTLTTTGYWHHVEHPFGTIKRQWGFNYITTKKYMTRAEADCGFVLTAYNLRRIINLMGGKVFGSYRSIFTPFFELKTWFMDYL